jgi:hypothetical protein
VLACAQLRANVAAEMRKIAENASSQAFYHPQAEQSYPQASL